MMTCKIVPPSCQKSTLRNETSNLEWYNCNTLAKCFRFLSRTSWECFVIINLRTYSYMNGKMQCSAIQIFQLRTDLDGMTSSYRILPISHVIIVERMNVIIAWKFHFVSPSVSWPDYLQLQKHTQILVILIENYAYIYSK